MPSRVVSSLALDPGTRDDMYALIGKGLLLLVVAVIAYVAWRRKNAPSIPETVPVPGSFDDAARLLEQWTGCKPVMFEESNWAADHVPSPSPARAVSLTLPPAGAQALLARVREPWERAGFMLVRSSEGLRMRGLPERPACVLLFDTTDVRRIARHVGVGADEGVTARELDEWLAAVQAMQPFRLELINSHCIAIAFDGPVTDAAALARLALKLNPRILDAATLEVITEEALAREIAAERGVSIAWD